MNNRIYRTLAMGIGLTAMFATSGLHASVFYTAKVNIPFEFKAGKRMYSAGQYRVEQDYSNDIAFLVNIKTGHRVQMLHPLSLREPGTVKITFESTDGVRILKKLS